MSTTYYGVYRVLKNGSHRYVKRSATTSFKLAQEIADDLTAGNITRADGSIAKVTAHIHIAKEISSDKHMPEPATTPPALFPMSELHVEAALCLWEAALEMQARSSATQGNPLTGDEVVPHVALDALFADHGTNVMRHAIMQLAPACCAEWDLLDDQQQEALAPFDWEFVPDFLHRCITDGRLLIAIENQYRKDADRLPIAAFPAP